MFSDQVGKHVTVVEPVTQHDGHVDLLFGVGVATYLETFTADKVIELLDELTAHLQRPTWHTGTPPTEAGNYDEYIVAVRRKAVPGRVFVFASNYANNYGKEELNDQDGDEYIANGWYTVGHDTSGEFDTPFMPMLESGDEVIGWQPLPKWDGAPC